MTRDSADPTSPIIRASQVSTSRPGNSRGWQRIAGPAVILLAAGVATAPQLFRGNSCGHDFDIHLVSWFDCLSGWRHGILYPQWTPSPNYGAGEPRFIFYPPLTWMLGAALGAVLPWQIVPIILTFLLLAATGLGTRTLALRALPDAPATLAGCVAIFSGYALFTAYERSAFGELAGFWIPLLLLFILRNRNPDSSAVRRAFDGSCAPLAIVLAGAWLSNAPLGVMASYLLAAVALILAVLRRSWAPILRATTAAGLGIALAGFYLVPAAWEQRWVDIRQATDDPGLKIENSFLFARPSDPALDLHNIELNRVSLIAISMAGIALAGLLVAWRRKTLPADRRWWIPLALIPIAVLFMQLPVSLPLWNLLPKLRFLQFPWRWLRVAVAAGCAALFLASTAIAAIYFFQPCDDEDAVVPMVQVDRSGAGFEGVYEYEPIGADDGVVPTGLPDSCLVSNPSVRLGVLDTPGANPDWWVEQHSCDAVYSAMTGNPEHLHIQAAMPHAGYLILRLRTYPAWRITVNGRPVISMGREDGLTVVPVDQGRVEVDADWTTTADVHAGRWLSLLATILVTALWLWERRTRAPRSAHLS